MTKQLIEDMTWAEVSAAKTDNQVVIIPLGAAAKEHGLHLPMKNDYVMANYLRDRILEKFPNALALPTINYSYYPAFIEYPGSTSLSEETAQNMIIDICMSLSNQGFDNFYVLNTGFSTIEPLEAAKQKLAKENIIMSYLVPTDFFDSELIKKVQEQKYGSHADEVETSMMLYIAPNIVNMEKAVKADDLGKMTPGPLTRDLNAKKGFYSPTGATGNPTLATKEKGKIITEAYVTYIVDRINKFLLLHAD